MAKNFISTSVKHAPQAPKASSATIKAPQTSKPAVQTKNPSLAETLGKRRAK